MKAAIKTREEVWTSMGRLSEDRLNQRVEAGKWTIAQVLEQIKEMKGKWVG
jgi:hypothetical protein